MPWCSSTRRRPPRLRGAFRRSASRPRGLPRRGVFQVLHLEHADTETCDSRSAHRFCGLYRLGGGRARPCSAWPPSDFIGVGLELGGCDPVYVRHDADLPHAIENIVDGAYFNSGQSCCGLQRIYVHESIYKEFAEGCTALVRPVPARQSAGPRDHPRAGGALPAPPTPYAPPDSGLGSGPGRVR